MPQDTRAARRPHMAMLVGNHVVGDSRVEKAAVSAIRAGDRAEVARPPAGSERPTPAETLAMLREATEQGEAVWIGYVDNHGTSTERIVEPRRVDGGQLTAYDHRSEDLRGFAIHRITAVRPVE